MSISSESKYTSFIKPMNKFWTKSSSKPIEEEKSKPIKEEKSDKINYFFNKKKSHTIAYLESSKSEIYKLSDVDQQGLYIPPSPTLYSKHDHWVQLPNKDEDFYLPSTERLTDIHGDRHNFYTPSETLNQPYLSNDTSSDSTLSSTPSLLPDDSSLSSIQ